MDSRFIKLSNEEAIWIKTNLRNSENTFQNILTHILNYHQTRKKETVIKNKLKVSLSQLKLKITQMELTLPEKERKDAYEKIYENEKVKKHHGQSHHIVHNNKIDESHIPHRLTHLHKMINHEQRKNVDEELDDIKRKLEKLQN